MARLAEGGREGLTGWERERERCMEVSWVICFISGSWDHERAMQTCTAMQINPSRKSLLSKYLPRNPDAIVLVPSVALLDSLPLQSPFLCWPEKEYSQIFT